MNTHSTTLGDFLKNYRLAEELTQDDLSKLLHVSKQRVSDIEKNRFTVSVKLCKRMARALDLPVEWLAKLALQDMIDREGIDLKVG